MRKSEVDYLGIGYSSRTLVVNILGSMRRVIVPASCVQVAA